MATHAFLFRNEKFLNGEGSAQAFAARKAELAGVYLILDEGSMISNEQMDKLTAIANLMEVGRLAIIGDRKQLNPIDARSEERSVGKECGSTDRNRGAPDH